MMRNLVIVLTCQRPNGVSYLRETLKGLGPEFSVSDEDADTRYCVVSDGPMDAQLREWIECDGWTVHASADRRGSRHAHWRCLYLAAALDAERLFLFEDDVQPCVNALAKMVATPIPDELAFLTFFDIKEVPEGSERGVHLRPTVGTKRKGFWGLQAVSVPRRTVEFLCRTNYLLHMNDKPETTDMIMGNALEGSPWPLFGVHVPSLVEHVGDVSNIFGPDYVRRARNWPGAEFDAASLPLPSVIL